MTVQISGPRLLTPEQAVLRLRADPAYEDLVRDAYVDADTAAAAVRFAESDEFREVLCWLGDITGRTVLDLGAGNGIATVAFARAGAGTVIAIEPDASQEIGRGAIARVAAQQAAVLVIDAVAEDLPLESQSVDIVYARQTLHHLRELDRALRECFRILRPGGRLVACREHVVDDEAQLKSFLAGHPVHQMTGGENAYRLDEYGDAISRAGFAIERIVGPFESVVNAFPAARTAQELADLPAQWLAGRFGRLGLACAAVPGVRRLVKAAITRPVAGRLYSFVARKPA